MCSSGTSKVLPSCENSEALANDFAKFFTDKIDRVVNKIDNVPTLSPHIDVPESHTNASFNSFRVMSEDEIRDIIIQSPSSSSALDCILTDLLKIVNRSLTSGIFPYQY